MTPSNATNSASTAAATTAVAAATPGGCLVDLPEDSTILFWELIAAITSIAMLGVYFQAIATGEGPVANWQAHIADPFEVNGFNEVFATKFSP